MIKLLALDVDGTLTDGGIYLDGQGNEFKRFDVQDGYGLAVLLRGGIKVVFISGRYSAATKQRAENLGITECINGTSDKLADLIAILKKYGISQNETAYIGDDIPDIECIKWAGIGMATANARTEVISVADWCSSCRGGHGAVRECAEHIVLINGEKCK
ncbi:MAG: HAD-IIIA family hydrolase [Synergistaceae bacterium]